MVLVCHVISQNHVIERLCSFMGWCLSCQVTILWLRHCGSGDMMFLVVKGQDSTGPCFSPPLVFISKGHGLKACGITYQQHRSKQQLQKNLKITFVGPSKRGDNKEKEKKNQNDNCKAFCVSLVQTPLSYSHNNFDTIQRPREILELANRANMLANI